MRKVLEEWAIKEAKERLHNLEDALVNAVEAADVANSYERSVRRQRDRVALMLKPEAGSAKTLIC